MPGARIEPRGEPQPRPHVLVCNHGHDEMASVVLALEQAGMEVTTSTSLPDSCMLLESARPDAIVLNPLALVGDGVELEMLQALQADDDAVPVLLLLDDLDSLAEARRWRLPLRDFLRKPAQATEALHRVELLLGHRRRYRTFFQRTRFLEGQISIDSKTGLLSETYFDRIFQLEWKRGRRHQTPLSLLMLDVDDFKSVNDSTEYSFGNEVLRKVGETLRATLRETDFPARCGGDEFCVLLPQTTPREAVQTAVRIRQRIAETVVNKGTYSRQITVSIGIDAHDGRSPGSVEMLRSHANLALKEAKRRGKNHVWLYAGEAAVG